MITKTGYQDVEDGLRVKIYKNNLYVETTDTKMGCLVQGGIAQRVYKMPYNGKIDSVISKDDGCGVYYPVIEQCFINGKIIRKGRIIY
jgi:hypothetical protein